MKLLKIFLASATLSLASGSAFAGAVVTGFDSATLPANDDGSTGMLGLGFTVNFFGNNYSNLWVNNNGNLTFDGSMSTFTPFNLYTNSRVIIAPFFADVDTRGSGSGLTKYGAGTWGSFQAWGATWKDVGYYAYGVDKKNTFQTVLVNRSDTGSGNFDIYFNYDKIVWETGGASGGSSGLGGSSARAGYSNGTALNSYELAGSAVNGALLDSNLTTGLIHNSNVNVDGRYLFQVRNGQVIVPTPDAGSTFGLMLLALGALAAARRKLS